MGKIILFMHTSLDGFIAGINGELDWINVDEEIFDFVGQRINKTDTALYGRVTYEMMENYWPTAAEQPGATKHDIEHSRWYNQATKVVLSKTMRAENSQNIKIIDGNLENEISKIKQDSDSDILIFGSPTAAHALMAEALIDGYWLFVNPVLLGQGISLFKGVKDKNKLSLVSNHVFSSGVVCLEYRQ